MYICYRLFVAEFIALRYNIRNISFNCCIRCISLVILVIMFLEMVTT